MARILLLSIALLVSLVSAAGAQVQSPPVNPVGQQQGGAPETVQHSTSFETIIALTGAALVLLVVCYPSRRY